MREMLLHAMMGAIGGGLLVLLVLAIRGRFRPGASPLWRGALWGAAFGAVAVVAAGGTRSVDIEDALADWQPVSMVEDFHQTVLQAEVPVLVEFYSTTCGPCIRLAPTMGRLAKAYDGRVRFVKINIREGESRDLLAAYRAPGVPTVLLFQDGREIDRWVGPASEAAYRQALDEALARESG